jgi:hypothetical protein
MTTRLNGMFLMMVALCVFSTAEMRFIINYKDNTPKVDGKTVERITAEALNSYITASPHFQAVVTVHAKQTPDEQYWIVTLYRSDCYLVSDYRLDLKDLEVVAITPDCYEQENDKEVCGTCPDPTVEIVISYIEDALFPGAIQHGWGTWSMAQAAGLKAALVIGYNESKQTMLNYLACPKLTAWGRIGHGSKDAIQMNDYKGRISASELAGLSNVIKGKTLIFNSCLCHNDPFEPAMKAAGVYFFAAGDISLSGGKEGVFSSFFNKAIKNKMELEQAMKQAISDNNYPNAWGYSGANAGPYHLQFGITGIGANNVTIQDDFSLRMTSGGITFKTNAARKGAFLMIVNPAGKIIYQNLLSQRESVWELNITNGQPVAGGAYIAVVKNPSGTGLVTKSFIVQ